MVRASCGGVPVEVATMNNGANEALAKRFEIGPEPARFSDARSETGSNDLGIDSGVDRRARLKESVRRKARQLERDVLVRVLRETDGNNAQAARILQMDYEAIYRKLRQYGIDRR
jgi:transcriptional regulator with GAF, ATPase, and Fis domain